MSEIDKNLLERYVAGRVTPDEAARVEAWLTEDPSRWSRVREVQNAGADADLDAAAVGRAMQEVWDRLAPEVGATASRPVYGLPRAGRRFGIPERGRRTVLIPLAAALLVLTVGGGLTATLWLKGRNASPAPKRVATTAPGERATFRLPDGTQVMLSVASTLRYPSRFESESREVVLEGEAYFDVVHQAGSFVVKAGELTARDLGTRFTVRAYPQEQSTRVVVREGKVAIQADSRGPEQKVTAGQLGRLGQGGVPVVEAADTGALFAWTEGKLVFDATPLREALPQLSRWFDLDFRLADPSLGDIPLSATLKTEPTPDVLASLSASLGLQHRQRGRMVTFYSAAPAR